MDATSSTPAPTIPAAGLRHRHVFPTAAASALAGETTSTVDDSTAINDSENNRRVQLDQRRKEMALLEARAETQRELADEQGPAWVEGTVRQPTKVEDQLETADVDEDDDDDEVHELLTGSKRPGEAEVPSETRRQQPEPTTGAGAGADERICRICFSDDVDDLELGKLFSPCVCRGTSRFVHQACLARWRAASANSTSFFACDQCGYRYRFRRTRIARVVTSRVTVLAVTVLLFTFIVWMCGFLANRMIQVAENRRMAMSGSLFEDWFVSDHIILTEGVREAVDFIGHRVESNKLIQDVGGGGRTSWIMGTLLHFTKGLSLVGLLSLFQTYVATSFFSPLGRGLYRAMRPAARRGGRDVHTNSMSQLVIVLFVVVGAAKAVAHVYRGVTWLSKRALSRIEDLVLDIGPT